MYRFKSSLSSHSTAVANSKISNLVYGLLTSALILTSNVLLAEEEVADVDPNALTPWHYLHKLWTLLGDLIDRVA